MMNQDIISQHWILKKYISFIEVVPLDHDNFLQRLSQDLSIFLNPNQEEIRTIIDWSKVHNSSSFFFDTENGEEEIKELLFNSEISETSEIILEFGLDYPIVKLPTNMFIENWYDFITVNGYMGNVCYSNEKELVMEFTDDSNYLLYSNFPIKKVCN